MPDELTTRDLLMPRLGETMEEGRIIAWLKSVGEEFKRGDAILEIETDKTLAEFPALMDGRFVDILADPGTMQDVGKVIAKIQVAGKPKKTLLKKVLATEKQVAPQKTIQQTIISTRKRATPIARRYAKKIGVSIDDLDGTGRRGRVELRDVLRVDGNNAHGKVGHINHKVLGNKTGTPVVFIHGFGGEMSSWTEIASQLANSGAQALILDLPGHGQTTIEAQHVSDLSLGLLELVQSVFANQPVHFVAHSLGAVPALELVSMHPTTGITLIAPAGLDSYINTGFINTLANPASPSELSHAMRLLTYDVTLITDLIVEHTYAQLSAKRLHALAKYMVSPNKTQNIDLVSKINRFSRELALNVLIGHHDQVIEWEGVFNLSPNVAVHHFERSGHMPHWDAPIAVAQIIKKGLQL